MSGEKVLQGGTMYGMGGRKLYGGSVLPEESALEGGSTLQGGMYGMGGRRLYGGEDLEGGTRKQKMAAKRNPWLMHVKAWHKAHPGVAYSEALKKARSTYKKSARKSPKKSAKRSAAKRK